MKRLFFIFLLMIARQGLAQTAYQYNVMDTTVSACSYPKNVNINFYPQIFDNKCAISLVKFETLLLSNSSGAPK